MRTGSAFHEDIPSGDALIPYGAHLPFDKNGKEADSRLLRDIGCYLRSQCVDSRLKCYIVTIYFVKKG